MSYKSGKLSLKPAGGEAATVTKYDLAACKAVVHMVDHLLLPAGVSLSPEDLMPSGRPRAAAHSGDTEPCSLRFTISPGGARALEQYRTGPKGITPVAHVLRARVVHAQVAGLDP